MGQIDFSPLWVTLKTGIVASVFSFFIGIAFAELVINTKGRVRAFWDGLLTLPMVLPPTVAGYILLRIFSTRRPFGSFLSHSMGIQVVHTWLGCVVAATIIALPLMYRNARAAFEQIDENVIYAARTLGGRSGRFSGRYVCRWQSPASFRVSHWLLPELSVSTVPHRCLPEI